MASVFLVAIVVPVAAAIIRRRPKREELDPAVAQKLTTWILVGGFVGAHLVDRFVYFPAETLADPLTILRFWEGLSSFGGFLGAIVAIALFRRRYRLEALWRYLDVVAYAFPFGWIIGRLGCFVAYDHLGSPTEIFIGQEYLDGVVRHNLCLEDALYTVVIASVFSVLDAGGARRDSSRGGWPSSTPHSDSRSTSFARSMCDTSGSRQVSTGPSS